MGHFVYCAMQRGNQHGSCKYDDLQNWLDMMSHKNQLLKDPRHWPPIKLHYRIHSKITMTDDMVPYYTATALVLTLK